MNFTLWMTGLSGSGKSTIAERFKKENPDTVVLDGDVIRRGLCSDLGFSDVDRGENMRRLIELCKLFNDNGKNVITAFISPFESWRQEAKERIENCFTVLCDSDLETCEVRDVKGLYAKARSGRIEFFTGISSLYEFSANADLILDTGRESVDDTMATLHGFIRGIQDADDGKVKGSTYWTNVDQQTPHMVFVGRLCPLHSGHTWIIEQMRKKNPAMPVVIFVRDTKFDEINAIDRAEIVVQWMKHNKIDGSVVVIPDIEGIYYGRGVGYNVEELCPPDDIRVISATAIREKIKNGDDSWKDLVSSGTAEITKRMFK